MSRLHTPPASPTSPGFWRSPVRGPWFTSVLGIVLLGGITALFVTGLLSYAAYNPDLSPVNDKTPDKGLLGFYLFAWPTQPHWLYRLTQGIHVTLGITLIPVLLAKLWSVVPKLFALPPARSLTHALERISLLLLVGGVLFEFVTGVLNVQLDYLFPGSFYPLHFYGAWVFIAGFVVHVVLRAPAAVRNLRRMRAGKGPQEEAGGEPDFPLVSPRPAEPTVSRRGALWFVGGGSLLLFGTTAGQSFDGPLRRTALLAPHGGADPGSGPGGFQINKTAASRGIAAAETREDVWRLVVTGPSGTVRLSRKELLELPLHSSALPIACVEGWSTGDQWWRGVRLRELAVLVGYDADSAPDVMVESLQRRGAFRRAALRSNQVRDPRSLLALDVNGEPLTPDHGYPARIIVPAAPGVLNTKWVARMTFGDL
ncbi:DMSO/TMAO reductase YedYZ molybdopterin-dependent catalytic subunit [Streptomyces umbrinus]|uniref:DMSO/TMAO reductase YedYZ molybdopterin-dependent catalytic subunit n=1 Tax=Streptomyces umbrinus TaxID=67370 RepID=A0ABU0TAH8_9ACTN|nr:molybdopterin-dependent oxidoreductase [Streptomyces umbrinus]MDQ1032825.1 DMSO/TMAO reductase YedYZ molybdopterin-dependent catalytic subunit [Streptomyces umbrinus]